jgi:hypothetical protein
VLYEWVSFGYSRTANQLTLDVDAPFLRAEVEGLERTLLAESLCLVDVLVTSIVSLTRVPLRVLVCGMGKLCFGELEV